MLEMNRNTEKRIMLDGEEAEIADSVEEAINISINISSRSNLYVKNSVGKLKACQPRCATAAGTLTTMQISAAFVSRHSAAFARSKVTF